jgi:glycerol-3-phosphate acyltransferase PlsX
MILVGPVETVRRTLEQQGSKHRLEIVDAPDLLEDTDTPVDAMRKKPRNSIMVGIQLVKEGKAAAFISAGSTGTVVATATVELRCLEGIRRPGIAAIIKGEKGPFLVIDVGANPQPKPVHLLQYGIMGAAYYRDTFSVPDPRVGILNIGSEELKGNPLVKEARALLKSANLNFAGNVEGVEVFQGECQVVVSDGFTGNVLLKVSEGVAEYVVRTMVGLMHKAAVEGPKVQQITQSVLSRVDYSEYGGALLLGVEGSVTICHGRSQAPAVCNAIRFAVQAQEKSVNQHIIAAARAAAASTGEAPSR